MEGLNYIKKMGLISGQFKLFTQIRHIGLLIIQQTYMVLLS